MADRFHMTPARLRFLEAGIANNRVVGRCIRTSGWRVGEVEFREELGLWMHLHGMIERVVRNANTGNTVRLEDNLFYYRVTDAGIAAVENHYAPKRKVRANADAG